MESDAADVDVRRRNFPNNADQNPLRSRLGANEGQGANDFHDAQPSSGPRGQNRRSIVGKPRASKAYVAIGIVYLCIGVFVHHRMNSYPIPKCWKNSESFEFREENARAHLDELTGLGPRVSGSDANMKAEEYILQMIASIQRSKKSHFKMTVDVQVTSGGLTLDFNNVGIGEFTSVYQDLRNVIVKVSPVSEANNSVLVNCHYDSVIDSPGAGDDAASCAVMLEMMRALTQGELVLLHNIVFLFNSAEENILQTSHGFITQHPWAPSIKAFVNLDSAGAGGWEIVFQTGPEHPWLIKAYIESAPYPHASVIGQEIFQTGLIPSDTDFRIFRDYGNIPGIDIAHIKNGYVYHTRNDLPRFIPPGCMQRGGENVLSLLKTLSTSMKLVDPGADKHGSMVFFDFLGFFMVAYPKRIAMLLNWTTVIYVYIAFVKRLLRDRSSAGMGSVLKMMLWSVLSILATWVVIVLATLAMALTLTLCQRNLAYYTHNLNIIWLFVLPSTSAAIGFHLFLKKKVFPQVSAASMVVMLQNGNLMLWSLVLALATLGGLMSSYLPLVFVLWPVICYTVLDLLGFKPTGVLFNLVGGLVPSVLIVYLSYTLLMFLIPIMGRVGMEASPDVLVGLLCALPVIVCLPYQVGFVYTHHHVGRVISTTMAVILLGLCAVLFTSAGFPYSSSPLDASPQRAMFVHYDRKFHSYEGGVVQTDANVWYKPLDFHGGRLLEIYSPSIFSNAKKASCDGVYCGRPYLYPFLPLVNPRKTYDFPASSLNVTRVEVVKEERQRLSDDKVRLNFSMTGPSHVTIFISELPKVKVTEWTFGEKVPVEVHTIPPIHGPTFFIYYSHAGPPNTTWHFSLDVQVKPEKDLNSPLITMGFAGHHLHGPNQITEDVKRLENLLPPWMMAVRWSATYDQFVF
ncbi:endoplasmic reticulum metallopeptidase 1 [Aplysia californica]|uniref:Endoplasmic reticulum metallopeptidase 1 n=1 Tax=Aplysia californica TaxID=6500 RepID=A0ABM1VZ20_APLCA|nr:endoplasmic reticulum metallopeptidase 1 [Aplysia californica]